VANWDHAGMIGLDGAPDKSTLNAFKTNRPIQVWGCKQGQDKKGQLSKLIFFPTNSRMT
jgi:hypothetical protein